jgi:hypothetical protein
LYYRPSHVKEWPDVVFVGILVGLVLVAAALVVRGLTRRRDRSRVTCACGRDVGQLAFRLPTPCACGAIVGGPPNDPTTAMLSVPPLPGRFGGRRPGALLAGAACLVAALALAALGGGAIARGGTALDALPPSALALLMPLAPESTLDAVRRQVVGAAIAPDDAASLLRAIGASAKARSIAFGSSGSFDVPVGLHLLHLASDAGAQGREALVTLAAPTLRIGKDDRTGEALAWIATKPEVVGVWFARIDDVRVDGTAVGWSVEERREFDRGFATGTRVLRTGRLRLHVPYDEVAKGRLEVRFLAASSFVAATAVNDPLVSAGPPEEWGIGGIAVPLTLHVDGGVR